VHSAKPRAYEGASHTTPIQPQQATQQSQVPQHGSPRLERAHSEPPKAFCQKLHKAQQQQQPQYMTIPWHGSQELIQLYNIPAESIGQFEAEIIKQSHLESHHYCCSVCQKKADPVVHKTCLHCCWSERRYYNLS